MLHKIRFPWIVSLLLAGLVLMTFLFAAVWVPSTQVRAQARAQPPVPAANDPLMPTNFVCVIAEIAVWPDKFHVRCDPGDGDITYFSSEQVFTQNNITANRYLVILNTAFAMSKTVRIYYNPDPASCPPGCLAINCRPITGVMIEK